MFFRGSWQPKMVVLTGLEPANLPAYCKTLPRTGILRVSRSAMVAGSHGIFLEVPAVGSEYLIPVPSLLKLKKTNLPRPIAVRPDHAVKSPPPFSGFMGKSRLAHGETLSEVFHFALTGP